MAHEPWRTRRGHRASRWAGASAVAAAPFAYLWVQMMVSADDPLTTQDRLDLAIGMAVFGTPWVVAAGLLWLAGDRHGRRVGVATALVLAAGFVLSSRLALRGVAGLDAGMMGYVLLVSPLVVLTGSAAAAAAGRSFRSGLAAAWATVLGGLLVVVAWLAEAPHWYRQGRGLLLDGEGGLGVGANVGDAVWWTLIVLALWALPLGVIGAAAGSARARRRARAQAELA